MPSSTSSHHTEQLAEANDPKNPRMHPHCNTPLYYYDTVSQSVQLCFRSEAKNAGTALYVTGLSSRVTGRELEEHFSKEGKMRHRSDHGRYRGGRDYSLTLWWKI
ncbi:hypothetical protein JHK87_030299 [Glycine soja]|nr:hypothetical protein JHK87_030299 [Glycine soja]